MARWSRVIDRRPVIGVVASLLVLAVLASLLAGIRLGFPDSGNQPKDTTTRQAYDMVAEGFGPGTNGPLIAVARTESAGAKEDLARLRAQIEEERNVVTVSAPRFNQAGDAAVVAITPSGGPSSQSTTDLVERLREGPLADAGVPVELGGQTASFVDQADRTAKRLPLFIARSCWLAFALLVGAFGAPVIALKAGVLTVLSIVASYGVVALIAEGGWAGQLVGIDSDVPVPPFTPVMMFAVMFGLAMDYEVIPSPERRSIPPN